MLSILSSTYFGPVQWYQKLQRSEECLIEQHENFVKQTYRNRCVIATTQGPQALTVPVEKYINDVTETKDIRISDHGNWRHLHWNALLSAYGESPFFEYYQDDIRPFYEKKYEFLFDFNMEIMEKMIELLDIRPKVSVTDRYVLSEERRMKSDGSEEGRVKSDGSEEGRVKSDGSEEGRVKSEDFNSPEAQAQFSTQHSTFNAQIRDFRDAIRPKKPLPDADFIPQRYYQVYEQKHGFLPNMSILDLLFNEGNEAIFYL